MYLSPGLVAISTFLFFFIWVGNWDVLGGVRIGRFQNWETGLDFLLKGKRQKVRFLENRNRAMCAMRVAQGAVLFLWAPDQVRRCATNWWVLLFVLDTDY